jgi:hypothetical protein
MAKFGSFENRVDRVRLDNCKREFIERYSAISFLAFLIQQYFTYCVLVKLKCPLSLSLVYCAWEERVLLINNKLYACNYQTNIRASTPNNRLHKRTSHSTQIKHNQVCVCVLFNIEIGMMRETSHSH